MRSHYVTQAGLELPGSCTSVPAVLDAGIIGIQGHTTTAEDFLHVLMWIYTYNIYMIYVIYMIYRSCIWYNYV